MAFPQLHPTAATDPVLKDPGGHYDSPMAVVWDPHLDHDERIQALDTWLDHERLLYRADRDTGRIAVMRQIESAIRTLRSMRRGEGAW
jgi:hypothetical protein